MSKGIWLTRDIGHYSDYDLVNGKPNKSEVGYFWVGTDSEWIGHFNSEPFERLTGFRLEPGEIARIPRKRFRELFRGLGK